jgi:uncharacterized integral membrane protein (TIGR00698 family)
MYYSYGKISVMVIGMLWKLTSIPNQPLLHAIAENRRLPVDRLQWACLIVFAVGASWMGSPAAALLLGLALALAAGLPAGVKWSHLSKVLLQTCVVMLGFSMDFRAIFRAGWDGALFSAVSIAASLLVGHWIGARLGVGRRISALISSGTAICGGSAIAAVSSVLVAAEEEIAIAIGTVFILNGVSLYLFPAVGHGLGLTQHQFGLWSGVAIHDISSVVGASMSYGSESLQTATAVKLARTLWIVPVALGYQVAMARIRAAKSGEIAGEKPSVKLTIIPWFIGGFLLASVLRTFVPAIADASKMTSFVARAGFVWVLLLIGASLKPRALRRLGWKTCAQGATLWILVSVGSLLAILTFRL